MSNCSVCGPHHHHQQQQQHRHDHHHHRHDHHHHYRYHQYLHHHRRFHRYRCFSSYRYHCHCIGMCVVLINSFRFADSDYPESRLPGGRAPGHHRGWLHPEHPAHPPWAWQLLRRGGTAGGPSTARPADGQHQLGPQLAVRQPGLHFGRQWLRRVAGKYPRECVFAAPQNPGEQSERVLGLEVHSPNLLKRSVYKWGVRIGSTIICHPSKLWKAKFFILCDVIFLVRLQGKFEIDHSWAWKGWLGRLTLSLPSSIGTFSQPF